MKKLLFYKPFKGLQVNCKCGKAIHKSQKNYKGCEHSIDKQFYKAVLFDLQGNKKTRNLKSLKYDEAVKELLEFQDELNNPVPTALLKRKEDDKPMGLIDCITGYLNYLEGVDVRPVEKKERSKGHKYNMSLYSSYFINFLKSKEINVKTIRIDEITDNIVDEYYLYVDKKTESNSTFNDYFKPLKGLFKYLIDKKDYLIRNPFKIVPKRAEGGNIKVISYKDYIKIKNIISPDNGLLEYKSGAKRNMYKDWLSTAIDLALFLGIRREQVAELRFSDIVTNAKGEPLYVQSNNLKVNRAQNRMKTTHDKIDYIEISDELKNLLIKLNFKENIGKNEYIICNNKNVNRETVVKQMSAGFSFYRDLAGVSKEFSFESLRKKFLTQKKLAQQQGRAVTVSNHSSNAVLDNHYIDYRSIAEQTTLRGFRLFEDEEIN